MGRGHGLVRPAHDVAVEARTEVHGESPGHGPGILDERGKDADGIHARVGGVVDVHFGRHPVQVPVEQVAGLHAVEAEALAVGLEADLQRVLAPKSSAKKVTLPDACGLVIVRKW